MIDSLVELREMTLNLPEHPTVKGTTHAAGDGVDIADVFISAHTVFPEHTHEELTVIVPYRGRIVAVIEGKEYSVPAGLSAYFLPGVPHYVKAPVDSWVIRITIPKLKG